MPFRFCPYCGINLEPDFRFCPCCGKKLLLSEEESAEGSLDASSSFSSQERDEATPPGAEESPALDTKYDPIDAMAPELSTSLLVAARPGLRKTRNSLRLEREVKLNITDAVLPPVGDNITQDESQGSNISPKKHHTVSFAEENETLLESPGHSHLRGKTKLSSPASKLVEGVTAGVKRARLDLSSGDVSLVLSPVCSPGAGSPSKQTGKNKMKKMKHAPAVKPLEEGEEVTDTVGKKWKLVKLLSQTVTEVIYEVVQSASRSKESCHVLKLGSKDGRIFTEQNFLQRTAKQPNVDKWIKLNKMDFLGIPICVAFGLHADSYRFLVFPNMGQPLQSVIEENDGLPEKTVLQLACRLLDVLMFVHSNEYVHANISAENIYIGAGQTSEVYLAGYYHAFRYCPAGKHVNYREESRTPHEGALEFISLDTHKGAAPSRRSDLQSLGYCMLRWHTGRLPWTDLTQPEQVATLKQRYMNDVPALLGHCFSQAEVSSSFQSYLNAVMALQYTEQPDYSSLKNELSTALLQMGGSVEEPLSF
ncbi:serine/threonine-protein kinase VRK3 [Cynoglossus semilaevis]|uniref:VRK serine/threonine kinase 3 n=1 Tax=Cynoglossus semilaevis TaxID=244447 RepID=A0A3P8WXH9_CYNSE|nr:inactive serine/threonine-protein kinase VRK3 [Cynoglossus semilaevis]XP_008335165.1 inactive serine/threonine-protein kinase VRK3 [Cynoglossus semilaevis]XP_024909287.1 inactive serine/threonine-protein kinase VRK3 [Cynoglossus semilaevis]